MSFLKEIIFPGETKENEREKSILGKAKKKQIISIGSNDLLHQQIMSVVDGHKISCPGTAQQISASLDYAKEFGISFYFFTPSTISANQKSWRKF